LKTKLPRKALTLALTATLLAGGLATLPGCEFFGWIAQAIDPPIKKLYELPEEQPILVVVDDPNQLLGSQDIATVLAARVGWEIEQNVDDVPVIPQEKLDEYRKKVEKAAAEAPVPKMAEDKLTEYRQKQVNDAFRKVPLTKIGRELGAKKVISIYVESAELNQDPSALRPRLLTRVKVVDVDTNARVFPPLDMPSSDDPMLANRGFAITSQFFNKSTTEENRGDTTIAMRTLAKTAGVDIAKLFYDHGTQEPGERFKTVQ
jgi:hypothetical protein